MGLILFKAGAAIRTARNMILKKRSKIFIRRIYLVNEPTISNHGKRKGNPGGLPFWPSQCIDYEGLFTGIRDINSSEFIAEFSMHR